MHKLLLASAAVLLALSAPALPLGEASSTNHINPLGYCQLTLSGTAALISTCSGGVPAKSTWAAISVETAAVRWRDDGTSPTATVGMPENAGNRLYYSGDMTKLSFIAQTGAPVIDISFYDDAPRT